jgi:hypothetical protein
MSQYNSQFENYNLELCLEAIDILLRSQAVINLCLLTPLGGG